MSISEPVVSDRYVDVEYYQFSRPGSSLILMRIMGVLTWPVVLPLAVLSRLSDFLFHTFSEFFALFPLLFGVIVRYEFYNYALTRCGDNVVIGFGTVFFYRDVEIGNNVHIGMYNTFHHCNLGSNVLIADGCRFLSGSPYGTAAI